MKMNPLLLMLDHYGHVEPDSERFELWNDTLLGRIILTTAAFLVNQQQIVIQAVNWQDMIKPTTTNSRDELALTI